MATPTTYLLRDIDPAMWRAAKARAAREGKPMRTVLLTFLALYGKPKPPVPPKSS